MSTYVADLEWDALPPGIALPGDTTSLLALVRRHGWPVGMLRLRASGLVPRERIRAVAEAQIRWPSSVPVRSPAKPVSIVVCTRDRPEDLQSCLEALRPHHAHGHDVVVVDNAPSTSLTAQLVAQYPYRLVTEPRPGLNHARNRGWASARHDVVAFTDDDCVPDPCWIDGLTAPYSDPRIAATTGLVMPLELETRAQQRFEAYSANRRSFDPVVHTSDTTPPSAAGVVGIGANMSLRRAWLERVGGFDPRFDGGMPTLSGGDAEMFARLLAAGGAISYRPGALVWHRHRREIPALRRVIFGYGAGIHAMLWKRLVEDGDREAVVTAMRWLVGPPLKAVWNAVRGRPATSPDLLFAELWGACQGPWRFRSASRILRSMPA